MIRKTPEYRYRMEHHSVIISANLFMYLASIWHAET